MGLGERAHPTPRLALVPPALRGCGDAWALQRKRVLVQDAHLG